MGKFYDVSMQITNSLPTVKVTDDVILTVNNRKSNMLLVKKLVEDYEKREDADDGEVMSRVLSQMVGSKSAQAVEELDLPLPEYKAVYEAVMNAASGVDTPSESK